MGELEHKEITEKIIGAAFEVHNNLGAGFQEVIYQRAFAYELKAKGLSYAREKEQLIFYKDIEKPIGKKRADFIVEDKIMVEIKAKPQLESAHFAQGLNYLKAYKIKHGLLINFGAKSVEFKRLILSQKK